MVKRQHAAWNEPMAEIADCVSLGYRFIINGFRNGLPHLCFPFRRILPESQPVLLAPSLGFPIDVLLRITLPAPDDCGGVFRVFACHADHADARPMLPQPQPMLKRVAVRTVLRSRGLLIRAASATRRIHLRCMPRLRQVKAWPTGYFPLFRRTFTTSVAEASIQPMSSASLCIVKAGWAKRTVLNWIAKATSGAHAFRRYRNQHLIIAFLWDDEPMKILMRTP